MTTEEIDTTNDCAVAVQGDDIMVLGATVRMSKAKALRLAAWIAVLADPTGEEFIRVVNAVRKT